MKLSKEQKQINSELSKLKKFWIENSPICIFCLHLCTPEQIKNGEVDLCHKIRRSEAVEGFTRLEIQTMKLNTGLGHRTCHEIFDNNPAEAVQLPGFWQIMKDIKAINKKIYDKLISNIYQDYLKKTNLISQKR